MTPLRAFPALVALAGVALVTTGCESTQEKSAKIGAELGPVQQEKGLEIGKRSKDVRVVSATVLADGEGTAVVVEVHNGSKQDLVNVPIAIDVRDAKGRSVYRNDIPGLETALTAIPYVAAGGDAVWVNDQVLATGKPESVEVTVGAEATPFTGAIPEFDATAPQLEGDPYSGIVADGDVVNESGVENERVLLYAVARVGGEVVAAGRGAIENVKAKRKPLPYNVYFIGDPSGAKVTVTVYPMLPGFEER
jgi:hypothetical protein